MSSRKVHPDSSTPSFDDGVMTFRPTMEEFKDFVGYIQKMEEQGAHHFGIAKVIPPAEWSPRREPLADNLENIGDNIIPAPIEQNILACSQKSFQVLNMQKKKVSVREYYNMAIAEQNGLEYHDYSALERNYWRNLCLTKATIYGADVSGTLTDSDLEVWNCARLPSILDCLAEDYGSRIEGVNTPYLYYGMWKTTFAIHTEDMDLYSINYNHFGAPKFWYALAPGMARKFERTAQQFFPCDFKDCPAYLRHKSALFSPNWFKFYSIPFYKTVQQKGEFMITFPMAYHWGFNSGLNIAESTNFATDRWIEYGKRCSRCSCEPDRVNISMEAFVKKFQSNRYNDWLVGKDYGTHPDSPNERRNPAPPPTIEDLECSQNPTPECLERIRELRELRKLGIDPTIRGSKRIQYNRKKNSPGSSKTSKRQSTAVLEIDTKKLKIGERKSDSADADASDPDAIPGHNSPKMMDVCSLKMEVTDESNDAVEPTSIGIEESIGIDKAELSLHDSAERERDNEVAVKVESPSAAIPVDFSAELAHLRKLEPEPASRDDPKTEANEDERGKTKNGGQDEEKEGGDKRGRATEDSIEEKLLLSCSSSDEDYVPSAARLQAPREAEDKKILPLLQRKPKPALIQPASSKILSHAVKDKRTPIVPQSTPNHPNLTNRRPPQKPPVPKEDILQRVNANRQHSTTDSPLDAILGWK